MNQSTFDKFLAEAESDPKFGIPSYVVQKGDKFLRLSPHDQQYYYSAKLEDASRFRKVIAEEWANKDGAEIVAISDPHTRASNAFWRTSSPYRVVAIRMEGDNESDPSKNKFWGQTPKGKEIRLYTSVHEERMVEVFWADTQESPWPLYAFASDFK